MVCCQFLIRIWSPFSAQRLSPQRSPAACAHLVPLGGILASRLNLKLENQSRNPALAISANDGIALMPHLCATWP
jgi:hypothetical protein